MKKFLKIFFTVLVILIVLIMFTPLLFKGKINKIATEQINNNLNAQVSFSDVNLSLIRNFPYISFRLEDLLVVGKNEFEGDTLTQIESIEIAANLISAIKMEDVIIRKIHIQAPNINAIVLENGMTNWDIAISDTTDKEPEDTTASDFDAKITLKEFSIEKANIYYDDRGSDMKASLGDFNFELSGDMSKDLTNLKINSHTEKVNVVMDGINYLSDVMLDMQYNIEANTKESIYTLKNNKVSLNDLMLKFGGQIDMQDTSSIKTHLEFETSNTEFKTLLSLVPVIYSKDFNEVAANGKLMLSGTINGAVTENTTPNVDLKLKVSDASFSYSYLPKKANNIQIDIDVHYDGTEMDNTTVDVNQFHVELGKNPIDLVLYLKNPISDPFTNGHLSILLNLSDLRDVIPLEGTEITGSIKTKLDWMGKASSIENEKYHEFKADGNIEIAELKYSSPEMPKGASINNASISFSPEKVNIDAFYANIGKSDIRLNGGVSNYIPFILSDATVSGKLEVLSNYLDLNELTSSETEEEVQVSDTTAGEMEVVEIPENIDFQFTSSINMMLYDKITIENFYGSIKVKESKLLLENIFMETLEGTIMMSGEYNTKDIDNPIVDVDFKANSISITEAFKSVDLVKKLAPVASKATGNVSISMGYTSLLDKKMKPVMNTVSGKGTLASSNIEVKASDAFTKIGQELKTDVFNKMQLKDLNIAFEINEGNLTVNPFETEHKGIQMSIGGKQTLQNQLNYGMSFKIPKKMLGVNNSAMDGLYKKANATGIDLNQSDFVNLMAKITGKITDPKVSLDLKKSLKDSKEALKEQTKEIVKKEIKEKKEEVKKEAREKADAILRQAEQKANRIKSEAKKAADAVRKEADASANTLINKANNPIAKKAAKPAADKLRKEGEEKARAIEREADRKADDIMKEAQKKADDLLK